MYTKYPMSDKIKVAVYLDPELDNFLEENKGEELKFLEENKGEELKKSQYIRTILRKEMRSKKKRVKTVTVDDFFNTPSLPSQFVPDELKEYTDLLVEWWAIRYKNKGTCSRKVFHRIIDTLMKFPSQDRKEALEKAITGGWKDIYPLKKGYKQEEPKNNHPASRVFTAKGGFQ